MIIGNQSVIRERGRTMQAEQQMRFVYFILWNGFLSYILI